jgi:hypothetical protein
MEFNFFQQELSVKLMNCYLCDDGVQFLSTKVEWEVNELIVCEWEALSTGVSELATWLGVWDSCPPFKWLCEINSPFMYIVEGTGNEPKAERAWGSGRKALTAATSPS